MAGTSKPTETPARRVLVRAARENLGEFERRVRRRPGLGGATACLVILVVVMNFLASGPDNGWGHSVVAGGLLIIVAWGYVWFQRTRGGCHVFSKGFVDAAGRRLISASWSEIRSIEGETTQFVIGSLPVGTAFVYNVTIRSRVTGHNTEWGFNTTYNDVFALVELFSRRSGVPVIGRPDPYDL
jgi:hypothetical protein